MRRRGYFKHYNDASRGESLAVLAGRKDYLAICLYWYSLEILNQKKSDEAEVFIESLTALYKCRRATIEASYTAISEVIEGFQVSFAGQKVCIHIANYTKYQEKRAQKSKSNETKKPPIKDKRLKIKDKRLKIKDKNSSKELFSTVVDDPPQVAAPFRGDPEIEKFLANISLATQQRWLKLYGDESFIRQEILKAITWLENNPRKNPKSKRGASAFMTNWLARGWDSYRKRQQSKSGGQWDWLEGNKNAR